MLIMGVPLSGTASAEASGSIAIDGDDELEDMRRINGWSGTGVEGDPIVISGYEIDAGGTANGYGIWLKDTTKHVLITGCSVYNVAYFDPILQGCGILLDGVSNVRVDNFSFTDARVGISIRMSSSVTVADCSGAATYMGISAIDSTDLELSRNVISSDPYFYGINLNGCERCVLEDNKLVDVGIGLTISSSSYIAASGTLVSRTIGPAMIVELSHHIDLGWSTIDDVNWDSAVIIDYSDSVRVHNSTFQDLDATSIKGYDLNDAAFRNNSVVWTGAGHGGTGFDLNGTRIAVEGNEFWGPSCAVKLCAAASTIAGNEISGADTGIWLDECFGVFIDNNKISAISSGIWAISCEDVVMSDNTITMSPPWGGGAVSLSDCSSCTVQTNVISGTASAGISVVTGQDIMVEDNRINIEGDRGVYLDDCADIIVRENTISGSLVTGIHSKDGSDVQVIGNVATGFETGLSATDYCRIRIEGNDFRYSTAYGIYCTASDGGETAIIVDNDCQGCEASGISLLYCSNVIVESNDCSGSNIGIEALSCPTIYLGNNTCDECLADGLYIFQSDNPKVMGGSYSSCHAGITLILSPDCTLNGVVASGNDLYGLLLNNCDRTVVIDCVFSDNRIGIDCGYDSVYDVNANGLDISDCRLENNTLYGAYFQYGLSSVLYDNHFAWNGMEGLYLWSTVSFLVYNNTFLNNNGLEGVEEGSQAYGGGVDNRWYVTDIDGDRGNRWSNLKHIDRDGDGIVDDHYQIAVPHGQDPAYDHYPLAYGPKVEAPSLPTGVGAGTTDWGITVNFSPPISSGNSSIIQYIIYRGTSPDLHSMYPVGEVNDGSFSFYDVLSLQNGVTYYYAVTAVNADGFESELSLPVSVYYQPLPLGLDDIITIVGDDEFALEAAARSWIGDGSAAHPYLIQGLIIDGSGYGHCISIRDTTVHFVIRDCTLFFGTRTVGSGYGIELMNVLNARVEDCDIMACLDYEMYIDSSEVTVSDCYFTGPSSTSLYVLDSDGFTLTGSIIDSKAEGLFIMRCDGAVISANRFADVDNAIFAFDCIGVLIAGNQGSDGAKFLELVASRECIIEGNSITGYEVGFDLYDVGDIMVRSNIVYGTDRGISLHGTGSVIDGNEVEGATCGILLVGSGNVVANNTLFNNQYGLRLGGIWAGLTPCTGSLVRWNHIYDNEVGIYLAGGAVSNEVFNNRLVDNTRYGIEAEPGSSNIIYANLFQGNALNDGTYSPEHIQVFDASAGNLWSKNGLGNYWVDWTLPDDDGDGIVDLPYVIVTGVEDSFPLSALFGAPAGLRSAIGPAFVDLSWDGLTYDYQGDIDGYIVYRGTSPGVFEEIGRTTSMCFNDTDVELGATYYYRVAAYRGTVIGPLSAEISGAPANLPGEPVGLSAERGIGQVTLTWEAPDDDGGSAVLGYTIWRGSSPSDLALHATVAGTSFVDLGLGNGESYYYLVRAYNLAGNGTMTLALQASSYDVPSAPAGISAQFGDGLVNVSWATPLTDGGMVIQGYRVSVYDGLELVQTIEVGASSRWTVVSGLINGVSYTFIVSAYNEAGPGVASEAGATPATVTGPVAGLSYEAGDGEVVLTWSPPLETGGDAPALYRIYRGTSPGSLALLAEVSATGYIDSSSTNGIIYYYQVTAVNKAGEGPASAVVTAVPGIPTPPAGLTAEVVDGEVVLRWAASTPNGGALVAYKVFRGTAPDALSYLGMAPAASIQYIDAQVDPGVTYYYRVSAVTTVGESDMSGVAAATAPWAPPQAPRELTLDLSEGQPVLSWLPPLYSSQPSDYMIYRGTAPGEELYIGHTGSGAVLSFIDLGYGGGACYYVVKASNAHGLSEASDEVSTLGHQPVMPSAPLDLRAEADSTMVQLSWSAPSIGGPFTLYKIYRGTAAGEEVFLATVTGKYFIDTGLTNGVSYHYKVTAISTHGEGAWSAVSATPVGLPDAPSVGIKAGDGYLNLSWPASLGQGSYVQGYLVYRGSLPGTAVFVAFVDRLYYNDTGLAEGATYFYQVRAVNGKGPGAPSTEVSATSLATPSAVLGASASSGIREIALTWAEPRSSGGSEILGYRLYLGDESDAFATVDAPGFIVTDLENGAWYLFRIVAYNAVGESEPAYVEMRSLGLPGPVGGLRVEGGNGQTTLQWSAPAEGASGYTVYRGTFPGVYTTTVHLSGTFLIDEGLTNGITYYYAVAAVNAVGEGSRATAEAAPVTLPGAPRNLSAEQGSGLISLIWSSPVGNSDSAIIAYNVYRSVGEGPWAHLATVVGLGYDDGSALAGVKYRYRVSAVNSMGIGDPSAAVRSALEAEAGATPGAPSGMDVTVKVGSILLTWAAPSDSGGSIITAYRIYRSTGMGSMELIATVPSSMSSYSDIAIVDGQEYSYWIVAENAAGTGEMPASAAIATARGGANDAPSDGGALSLLAIALGAAGVAAALMAMAMVLRKK